VVRLDGRRHISRCDPGFVPATILADANLSQLPRGMDRESLMELRITVRCDAGCFKSRGLLLGMIRERSFYALAGKVVSRRSSHFGGFVR
jgi:hypothetical protein